MYFPIGAGSRGSTRHFRTTNIPETAATLLNNPQRQKHRTRGLSRLASPHHYQFENYEAINSTNKTSPYAKQTNPETDTNNPFNFKSAEQTKTPHANDKTEMDQFHDFEKSLEKYHAEMEFQSVLRTMEHDFTVRHLGVQEDDHPNSDYQQMLSTIKVKNMEELIEKTVPENIRITDNHYAEFEEINGKYGLSELECSNLLNFIAEHNQIYNNYIGQGFNPCETPSVIANNILRNPAWNTAYTPYQAEISQGRLEALFNFQTMIVELTGLELANASLLDESTACAEAMSLCFSVAKNKKKTFLIDNKCHPQNINVVQTRAALKGFKTLVVNRSDMFNPTAEFYDLQDVAGCILQYPDTEGKLHDYEHLVKQAHANKALVAVACDPLALTIMKTPGEFNADIAVGTTQRFGIPLYLGGPHAGFFATKDKYKRLVPGRIIGKTIDSEGKECFRLALQTREQHIKRDKATSNVCTAQALLANGSGFYGVYHGPEGLKKRATALHLVTKVLSLGIKSAGHAIEHDNYFDTIKVKVSGLRNTVLEKAKTKNINLRYFNDGQSLGISLNDITDQQQIEDLLYCFGCDDSPALIYMRYKEDELILDHEGHLGRVNQNFMNQEVFNKYHSEQEFSRYVRSLELKDLSLVDSMIPLGSCTMKLNSSTSLDAMTHKHLANMHPLQPEHQKLGWHEIFDQLDKMLSVTCGFDKFFLQPNSGAQGELAGLATIKNYHTANGEGEHRKYILIPTSAHGTNPASASLCGYKIKPIKVEKNGSIDVQDLENLITKYGTEIAGIMITYPSTYGVFEPTIRHICDSIHAIGGQVYLDGANMNAQLGLCRPGDYGADVSHLNLHKTFSGPHGGGGPGSGPIGVKKHLIPHLPDNALYPEKTLNLAENTCNSTSNNSSNNLQLGALAGTDFGSPLVLAISWMWMKMLGAAGMRKSSEIAILNANYMAKKLENHYNILFTGENNFVAHEFIIDIRPFKKYNIEALDVCKRLQDYGLHAGTMSWPIPNIIMFEPTESESKKDIDNYCQALIQIRQEIAKIESGEYDLENNPLKNAPHTLEMVSGNDWDKKYSREEASFPLPFVKQNKVWPTVGRVNDAYGDKNLVCSCEGMENYQ